MATKGKRNHNEKRAQLIERYRSLRIELRDKVKDQSLSFDEKLEAQKKLSSLPRNSAENRYRIRCELTGRPRGNFRKFRLCRMKFREMALAGLIPGVTKASW